MCRNLFMGKYEHTLNFHIRHTIRCLCIHVKVRRYDGIVNETTGHGYKQLVFICAKKSNVLPLVSVILTKYEQYYEHKVIRVREFLV